MYRQAMSRRGVVLDRDVLRDADRRTCRYFRDLMKPIGGTDSLLAYARFGGRSVGLLVLGRCGRPFSPAAVRECEDLLPSISLSMMALVSLGNRTSGEPGIALTLKERDVLDYLRLGYRNQDIALAMSTSPHTVRNQLASAYRKLGAANRAEAVALAGTL
jgi:DNA-binding CsgD family transcriptional regulator